MINIIEHYKNGGEIECKRYLESKWFNTYAPNWNWKDTDYRIKDRTININKKYKTRDGREVRIYATDAGEGYPIHGAYKIDDKWCILFWNSEGLVYNKDVISNFDLVEVWEPQDKEPIWAWNNTTGMRYLKFWDDKNKCVYYNLGIRNGDTYDSYAKVEHIEQWMLDMQKLLED